MPAFLSYLLRGFPGLMAASAGLWLLTSLIEAAAVVTVAPVVDLVLHPDHAGLSPMTERLLSALRAAGLPAGLGGAAGLFVLLSLLRGVVQTAAMHLLLRTKYAMLRDLMVGSYEDFFAARWQFFSSERRGDLLNTFLREISVVGDGFASLGLFFSNTLLAAVYLAVPLAISWRITALCLAAAAAVGAPFLLLGRWSYALGRRNTETANKFGGVLHEGLAAARVILGFGNQEASARALRHFYDQHAEAAVGAQTLRLGVPALYLPLGLLVVMAALGGASRQGLPLAELAALLYALVRTVPCLGQLLAQQNAFASFTASHEQVVALRARARGMRQRGGSRAFAGLREGLRLERVSFSYPERGPALRELDAEIPRGRMTAFAGESGAGKSTVIDLLMGLHEPESGRVLVDGLPLGELDILSYRRRIGYVPQDSVLFDMSIRDNLLWAKPDASEAELREALRRANAEEFVAALPEGLETVVGDRGARLSGGQAQRVALARAIVRRPELLILDEATSSLDSESERLIQRAIEELARDTTIVAVAHRLSTIAKAARIYVLERGRIVEQGDFGGLLRAKGRFARLAELQQVAL